MNALLESLPAGALLLVHALATWWMAGVIWMVQLVHYPLMALVQPSSWLEYEKQHCSRMTFVVAPAMLLEMASAVLLALRAAMQNEHARLAAFAGLALVFAVWLSTAFVQMPLHARLSQRFDARDHARLVLSNWLRTAVWSARAGLAGWMLMQ